MTRLTIEIEDIADKKACGVAVQQLFTALEEHYGEREADRIWNSKWATPRARARQKLKSALDGLEYTDQLLIFEYCAMAVPSKEGLAKELANKNVPLHEKWRKWLAMHREWLAQHSEERQREAIELARKSGQWPSLPPILPPPAPTPLFGPRGTTDWRTMLQQIKRVFRNYPEACAAVSEMPTDMREEVRTRAEVWCRLGFEMQVMGGRRIRLGRGRTKSKR